MRNLKRALSLAMASVMLLGMMVVGTGAASYTDVADTDNVEAIEVLKAVGVMTGDENGNFNPEKTVTRNEMAVVMANLLNLDYDYYTGATTNFKDVPAWAAPYVSACYANNIIAGTSATTFGGDLTVTAAQAGLMMMKAMGYFQYQPDFGDDWQLATIKQASKIKLYDGINSNASTPLTRNQVAQLTLNALEANMVEFNGDVGSEITTSDGTTINFGYKAQYDFYAAGAKGVYYNDPNTVNRNYLQLTEELYGSDLKKTTSTDTFERPSVSWQYKTNNVGTFAEKADLTYTAEVKLGTIYSDLGLSKAMLATAASSNGTSQVDFSRNGNTEAGSGNDNGTPPTALTALGLTKGDGTKIGGNGVLVQVYYDDEATFNVGGNDYTGTNAKITLVDTYAGEVTAKRAATSSADASITVTPLNAVRGGNYETEFFAVDDIVLYTYSNKAGDVGVQSVVKAEQITGELNGYTGTSTVVVGGTSYKVNKAATVDSSVLSGAVDHDVTLTLDAYGYVVDVDAEATSTNYAMVLKYKADDTFDGAKAELLFTDGTTKTVTLKADMDWNGATAGNGTFGTDTKRGCIVSYTVNNKDKYELTLLSDAASTAAGNLTTKGSATIAVNGSTVANGKTIFVVETASGSDSVYTAYTGIANVPTITNTAPVFTASYTKSGTAATVVFIDARANTGITSSTKDVVFVKGSDTVGQSYDSVKGRYYVYDAIVNGVITKIESSVQIPAAATGLYTTVSRDVNDIVTLSGNTSAQGVYVGTGTVKIANGTIGLNSTFYGYSDDCQVFYINTDGDISTSSIGGIATDATDDVFFKITDNEVTTIVVREKNSGLSLLLKATSSYAVNGATVVAPSNGGSDDAITATLAASTTGDVITLVPKVSAGATVGNITISGGNGTVSGNTYTTVATDDNVTITFTVTVISETGVSTTGTYALTITATT